MKFFISSSCRLGQIVNPTPYHHLFHHTHNTKEFIQFVKYIKDEIDIPKEIRRKVFRGILIGKVDSDKIDKNRLLKEWNESEYVVIEICSKKIYEENDIYLHHLAVDGGDKISNAEQESDVAKIQSQEDLHEDLKIIKKITKNKKLIILPHINPFKFEKRKLFINLIQKECHELNIDFLNISKFIEKKHTSDPNHLKDEGHKIVKDKVLSFISRI